MSLYAIGDLHLSLSGDKPMDVFGGRWENYVEKIVKGFSHLSESDMVVLCGDITWGMTLEASCRDFKFIDALPGRKVILKGNHDYWWTTLSKTKRFLAENDITTVDILHNNCFFYEGIAICGTRGWFYEEETGSEQDLKILRRELGRLETSLAAAGDGEKLCFLHYPPRFKDYVCPEIVEALGRYRVKACYYGHVHGAGQRYAVQGEIGGVHYQMVSADYVDFRPVKIL